VRAVRGRARRYPGLCSEAPPTLAFYDALIQLAPHAEHVLDVGCGSGDGTRRLAEHFDKVTGIDADADALAFAKEWAPFGRYVLSDLAEPPPIAEADAAVFADVLSHARRPGQLLRSVRRKLRAKSKVVLAEPAAFVTQSLSVPVRRAFSKRNMVALLARSGYACSGWICDQGSFLACVAEPVFESATERLVEGELAAERGDLTAALAGYRAAERSARTEVQREAVLGQGRVLFAAGDGDGSAKAFLRSREMDPKDSRGLAGLSQIVLASGDAHQALRIAVEAEDLEPTEAEAALALALAADALGLTEAFSSWRVVSRLCPDDPGIATKLARAAAERGDYAFCISVFERLRHYGDALGPAFHVTLAWLLMAQGRRSDAALEAQVAMALAPNDPAVLELWKSIEEERTSSG
jgi:SAM-dependent methyltransferase